MNEFLYSVKPPKLNQEASNLNRSITNEEVPIVIEILPALKKKIPGSDRVIMEFYQIFKKDL